MFIFKHIAISIIFAAAAGGASAKGPDGTAADYGVAVTDSSAGRTIAITPATKFVNVANGETVRFTIDGKSFGWHVYTFPNINEFDLKAIAPAGIAPAGVRVVVAPDPLYFGA